VPIPFFITSEFKSDSISPPYLLPSFYEKETNLKTSNCISSKQLAERIMGTQEENKKEDKNQPPI
jgi:hypothetical protein